MSEKIAVHCPTKELWDKVREGHNIERKRWDKYEESTCINPNENLFCSKSYYIKEGYTIISAADYLKDEVTEFQVGDRVECTNTSDSEKFGNTYTIKRLAMNGLILEEMNDGIEYMTRCFKLSSNKPTIKTTKEETMKENNTNQDVLAVFGSKVKGDELVVIDRHFDSAMLNRILMEKFSKEIQAECKDAEEKRLAAEDK